MPTKYRQPSDAEFALLDHLRDGDRCYQTPAGNWRMSVAQWGSWQISQRTVLSCVDQKWARCPGKYRDRIVITSKGKGAHARKTFVRPRRAGKKSAKR